MTIMRVMKERTIIVIDLDGIAQRWQISLERVKYFITDCQMDPAKPGEWAGKLENWNLLIKEKQQAFDTSLFPGHLRPESSKTPS
jgi:hypothetical protein